MATFSHKSFQKRHIGVSEDQLAEMLNEIGVDSLEELIFLTLPDDIRRKDEMNIPEPVSEYQFLRDLKKVANKNKLYRNFIGQGYYGTITPAVILRNIFENPGWYTQYTPYQAEIAQGRLEALLNFQTAVSDLTAMPIANASLLDEGTAAAEAMAMFEGMKNKKRKKDPAVKFFVDEHVFAQTVDVMITRAEPLGIEIVRGDYATAEINEDFIGVLIQYPNSQGSVQDYRDFTATCKENDVFVCVAADLLALSLLTPPGEWGADAVVGNTQRFGVPMGYGGPHAGYFATTDTFKRLLPGRIIGVSEDRLGNRALRMALQTREQHIKREKATSNICTAQALLAIMAGMYAVYHGSHGIIGIAKRINEHTGNLYSSLKNSGYDLLTKTFFDTVSIKTDQKLQDKIRTVALENEVNFFYGDGFVSISIDETTDEGDIEVMEHVLSEAIGTPLKVDEKRIFGIPESLKRTSDFLTHEVFYRYQTETKLMRYIKSLEKRDLSLVHSMIPLGSCTMKLNAATELIPVSWVEFSGLHPFVPSDQAQGYRQIFDELSEYLCEITGFEACSLQPNSGAQGEYAGLMVISAYHRDRGEEHRNIALIPSSAHGTNPASAVMAGMKVVVVQCDEQGNIDYDDLKAKAEEHKDNLAALMITYPSTHGVYETKVKSICKCVHDNGGLVYMDGANMNAQVGLTAPGLIGADVCHLNLHKTFAIPHGGGGPGMGPICVNDKLAPFLPGHALVETGGEKAISAISAAPWGSASILIISYAYIKLLGKEGLLNSTIYAILNANYMRAVLDDHFSILYTGDKGMCAHEMILDLRPFKPLNVSAEDVAKRLIDYGFHAPTLSFPVNGTIMIEPTESEDKEELDRFCEAMISIKGEIDKLAKGEFDQEDNVLINAPHTLHEVTAEEWHHAYTKKEAVYALDYLYGPQKFWPHVARVNNAFGDRNLICTCPPIEDYQD